MVLIACAVVPWQLWQELWSIVVFVPAIIIYAIYLAVRAIMPGGTLDQAYDDSAATLEPLGLRLAERPKVKIRRAAGRAPAAQHESRARRLSRASATAARSRSGSRARCDHDA